MRHAQFYGAHVSDDDAINLGNGAGDVVNATRGRLVMQLKHAALLSLGGIIVAARHMAAIGRSRAERTVVMRFVAGHRWTDFTERTLNDELTGQNHRSFLP